MSNKRIKSGLIVFGSVFVSALGAIVPTVEFSNFVQWLKDLATGAGIPTVVISLIAAIISQAWFAWRNKVNEPKYAKTRTTSSTQSNYTPY